MTRILRNTFSAAILTSAAIMLAGCPTGTGAVIPGATGVGSSTAPGTTPAASACAQEKASGTPAPGTSAHGAYNAQLLPDGWATAHKDEAAVTAAFRAQEGGANWACMQKFYAGAISVYMNKKNM